MNTVALPTQTESEFKKNNEKERNTVVVQNEELISKYGRGSETLGLDEVVQSCEGYVEFTRDGKIKKRTGQAVAVSKYPEDVMVGQHLCVWGSWWNDVLGWGYACCHSNTKYSPCYQEKG